MTLNPMLQTLELNVLVTNNGDSIELDSADFKKKLDSATKLVETTFSIKKSTIKIQFDKVLMVYEVKSYTVPDESIYKTPIELLVETQRESQALHEKLSKGEEIDVNNISKPVKKMLELQMKQGEPLLFEEIQIDPLPKINCSTPVTEEMTLDVAIEAIFFTLKRIIVLSPQNKKYELEVSEDQLSFIIGHLHNNRHQVFVAKFTCLISLLVTSNHKGHLKSLKVP